MNPIAKEVKDLGPWYHTFDLGSGVSTPGFFDLRSTARRIPLPPALHGKRCLDAAACEGFWSFQMADRNADSVVSIDLPDTARQDWQGIPADETVIQGTGMANEHFAFVQKTLGASTVERVDMNLYDVNPDELGLFDFVFIGNVLIHLADPARALKALRSVMKPNAEILSLETISFALTALSPTLPVAQLWDQDEPRWWTPNLAAHRRLVESAGFTEIDHSRLFFQPFGKGVSRWPEKRPRTPREVLFWLTVRRVGVASGWVRAKPLV